MVRRKFFENIESDGTVIGTVTGCEARRELVGEKFIIEDENDIVYSGKDLGIKGEMIENFYEREKPALLEVEIDDGQCMEIYLESVERTPRLIIFGGGHVAHPLAAVGKVIGFEVVVFDDRAEFACRERFPEVDKVICAGFTEGISDLKFYPDDYIVIVTRGHKFDYSVLSQVIDKNVAYIGMIGSKRKVKLILDELVTEDGFSRELVDRVYAPVGLPIGSETPAEIAVSICSQIIKVRRQGQ